MEIEKIRFLREKLRYMERQMSDAFGRDSGCCGLTLAQCHSLLEVGYKGKVSLVELASSLSLDTSTLSRMIQGLVLLGLVNRETSEKDRRYVVISLTNQGRTAFDEIEARFNSYFTQVMEFIPAEKREAVIESIGLFSDAVRKQSEFSSCCQADDDLSENGNATG